jgi:serine/threonine protein kinase
MSQEMIGEKLGSFRLEQVLGSGAMGMVFLAVIETSGRRAAVKIAHGELAQKGKVFERFQREAEIVQQFRHPNIVRFLAWGRYKGTYYFGMEYIEGPTLEKVLQERGELPWREVVKIGIQLCDALQYAHEKGVIHRDLKPSNLMLTNDGRVKLTDFGIAKDMDRTALTAPGRTLGTAAYMAPEQIRGNPAVSHKTDLYALGVLLYQMLVGKTPFEGSNAVVLMHAHLNEPPPRPSDRVQEIPKQLDDLIVSLMAKSPVDRPWDAQAVGQVLRELRDKATRQEDIPMVWPAPGSPQANPQRPGLGPAPSESRKKGVKGTASRGSQNRQNTGTTRFLARLLEPEALQTAALVAALLAIGGFIAYWVWPPSAKYLYDQAVPLMASSRRADWITARDEYFEPLERRFPDHPYKEEVQRWRDQIALDEAEGRARMLSSPVRTRFSEPQDLGERQFVTFEALARKAAEAGDEAMAASYWQEMARTLRPDNPEERKWYLLANQRADELESRIRERRAFVIDQLERSARALQAGRPNEAVNIRAMLNEKYGRFADVADLLRTPPLSTGPQSPRRTNNEPPPDHATSPPIAPGTSHPDRS